MSQMFFQLTPHQVMKAVETAGFQPTGEFLQLNSYENRVFDIFLEKDSRPELKDRIVAKFYRPGRWSQQTLQEEHDFIAELKTAELPVVAPLQIREAKADVNLKQGSETLFVWDGMWVALFPRFWGRIPQELLGRDLYQIGRTLAQAHNIGARRKALFRPTLDTDYSGRKPLEILDRWLPPELKQRYFDAAEEAFDFLDEHLNPSQFIRIHGDCHRGNFLLHESREGQREFMLVDFDDFVNGPPAQDFWMLLSGLDESSRDQILEGYEEFRELQEDPVILFEPLRALRLISYASWISTRWEDPSFPRLFPHFNSFNYWAEEVEALERIAWSL